MISNTTYIKIVQGLKQAYEEGKTPAFAYDRVSTVEQTSGMSLEYQSQGALKYAKSMNLFLVYSFSVAESASKEGRRIFNEMIDIAFKYDVKNLIFKSTDRMSRNYRDLARIMDLVENHGVTIHYYQTNKSINRESTHDEKFMIGIEQAVAKHLSDKISHDIRAVNRYKVQQGIYPGRCPYGYVYNREIKRFVIEKNSEYILRFIFDEYDGGSYSLNRFCDLLNEKGLIAKQGGKWSKSSLEKILKNPFYHGEFIHRGNLYGGTQEIYYEKDRYVDRQKKLHESFNIIGHNNKDAVLQKFVRCECGKYMSPDIKKKRYLYYVHKCANQQNRQVSILESDLFARIDLTVEQCRFSPGFAEFLRMLFEKTLQESSKDVRRDLLVIRRKISSLEVKKDRLYNLFLEDDYFSRDDLKRKLENFDREIKSLKQHQKSLGIDAEKVRVEVAHVISAFRDFPGRYAGSDRLRKAAILREMADGAVFSPDGVEISWKKPFSFFMRREIRDINKMDVSDSSKTSTSAGHEGIEPPTYGFGDRCSAN